MSNLTQRIYIECPGDKLHEALHQVRDMGFQIQVRYDDMIECWVITLD